MRKASTKILLRFGIGILVLSVLACGSTPTVPAATSTSSILPTEAFTPTFTTMSDFASVSVVSRPTDETGKSPDYTIKAQRPFLQGSEDLRVTNFNDEMNLLTQEEISKLGAARFGGKHV